MIGTSNSKNQKLIFAAILSISVLVIASVLYTWYNRYQQSSQTSEISVLNSNSQFPLLEDGLGLYGFRCTVTELLYENITLSNQNEILLSASCKYLNSLGKEENITVPLAMYNPGAERWLIDKYEQDNLSLWQDKDFKLKLERFFYYDNLSINSEIYNEEALNTYDYTVPNKPNLDAGDVLLVRISKTDGQIYDPTVIKDEYILNGAKFNQDYHLVNYGAGEIEKFITTGRTRDISLENNILVPTFVQFLEDSNPS